MEEEIWKDIPRYEGLYKISNLGRIKDILKDKIKNISDRNGYDVVSLKSNQFLVHRLVAEAFVLGKTEKKNVVNHKDFNKKNNSSSNLEWCTNAENARHYNKFGIKVKKGYPLYQIKLTGEVIAWHRNSIEAATVNISFINPKWECKGEIEVIANRIRKNCRNEIENCYGYKWSYAN